MPPSARLTAMQAETDMAGEAPFREGQILSGPSFNEPMRVEVVRSNGQGSWTAGLVGTKSERFRSVSLAAPDIAALEITGGGLSYDGDGRLLRLALEAHGLGIAHEFDPYFGLSISRCCEVEDSPQRGPGLRPGTLPWNEVSKVEHCRMNVEAFAGGAEHAAG